MFLHEQNYFGHPDTAVPQLWFRGPDTHPSRPLLARPFDVLQKKEDLFPIAPHPLYMGTDFPRGIDHVVTYTRKGGKDPQYGQYYYLAHTIQVDEGVHLDERDLFALGVNYASWSAMHPILVTDHGIYWINGDTGGTHMCVEIPFDAMSPPIITHDTSHGAYGPRTHTLSCGSYNGKLYNLEMTVAPQLIANSAPLALFASKPYSFSASRNGVQVALHVSSYPQ